MPNDEINRYMKMEKLLENKISRRFKVRRLEINDLDISWNIFTAGTVSLMKIMSTSYQRKIEQRNADKILRPYPSDKVCD